MREPPDGAHTADAAKRQSLGAGALSRVAPATRGLICYEARLLVAFEASWSLAIDGVQSARTAMGSAPSRTLAALTPP